MFSEVKKKKKGITGVQGSAQACAGPAGERGTAEGCVAPFTWGLDQCWADVCGVPGEVRDKGDMVSLMGLRSALGGQGGSSSRSAEETGQQC